MEKDKEYLSNYLSQIKSTSKNTKYKRICMSPLRYAGGKSKAVGLVLENLPELKEKKIVSPFFGGGSLEIVLSKELGYEVIGYDIFSFLTNFWDQLINNNKADVHGGFFTKIIYNLLIKLNYIKIIDLKNLKKLVIQRNSNNKKDETITLVPLALSIPRSLFFDRFLRFLND